MATQRAVASKTGNVTDWAGSRPVNETAARAG
jgi:hypothetical protein